MNKYLVEWVKNGFWLGRFKQDKVESLIEDYAQNDYEVVAVTELHARTPFLFKRCGVMITFRRGDKK